MAVQGIILFLICHVISNLLLKLHGVSVCILSLQYFFYFLLTIYFYFYHNLAFLNTQLGV